VAAVKEAVSLHKIEAKLLTCCTVLNICNYIYYKKVLRILGSVLHFQCSVWKQ
jgi:hypothetical protein